MVNEADWKSALPGMSTLLFFVVAIGAWALMCWLIDGTPRW